MTVDAPRARSSRRKVEMPQKTHVDLRAAQTGRAGGPKASRCRRTVGATRSHRFGTARREPRRTRNKVNTVPANSAARAAGEAPTGSTASANTGTSRAHVSRPTRGRQTPTRSSMPRTGRALHARTFRVEAGEGERTSDQVWRAQAEQSPSDHEPQIERAHQHRGAEQERSRSASRRSRPRASRTGRWGYTSTEASSGRQPDAKLGDAGVGA
jgi:hypothetical protein